MGQGSCHKVESIQDLSDQRLVGSERLMARAFFDDPLFRHVLPGAETRQKQLPGLFRLNLRYGCMFGELFSLPGQGLAIWLPPGKNRITVRRALQAGMWLAPIRIGLRAVMSLARLNTTSEQLHAQFAPDLHWYLFLLGVDPDSQGQGLGAELIKPMLARADATRMPCYLETNNPSAVRFYQKHGFEVVSERQTTSAGLILWSMRRESRLII